METEKVRDARLRRLARRLGFGLAKVGTRYILLDGKTHRPYWVSMPQQEPEEIERFLTQYQKNRSGEEDQ